MAAVFSCRAGRWLIRLQPYAPGILRIEAAAGDRIPDGSSPAIVAAPDAAGWSGTDGDTALTVTSDTLTVSVDKHAGRLAFTRPDGAPLGEIRELLLPPAVDGQRAGRRPGAVFRRYFDERWFGAGVIGDELSLPAATVELENDNGKIRVPVLHSTRGYAVFWDNPARGKIQLFPDGIRWQFNAGDKVDFYLLAGADADGVIANYRRLTGRVPLPPKWALGFWFSKNRFRSQAELLAAAAEFRARKFPVDLLVQDYFYWQPPPGAGREYWAEWGSHDFAADRYPDPAGMVAELHRQRLRFMLVIWPRFDYRIAHARELAAAGALFPPNGKPDDWSLGTRNYDAFSAAGRAIYGRQFMAKLGGLGVDAWWLDASEPEGELDTLDQFDTGSGPAARVLCAYPLRHAQAVHDAVTAGNDRRPVLLTRSSWAGLQRFGAMNWTGDVLQDWANFSRQLRGLQHYVLTGQPYITTDIGGYEPTPEADDELLARWFEWGACCPLFRLHGINRPLPWENSATVSGIMAKFTRLRYRLLPYIYTAAANVTLRHGTLLRPLMMDFAADPGARGADDEFMFGPALLAAPVHRRGARERRVYLPGGGRWHDFWTGAVADGGTAPLVAAPLDAMPLFARAGAILPLGPELQYADEKPADPLELRVYPGADGAAELYEDAGEGSGYLRGERAVIKFRWDDAARTLTVSAREGAFPGMLARREFQVVIVSAGHGTGLAMTPGTVIRYDGRPLTVQLA
ncbi:MAG: DUF5110 domain-containing protein [Verrucomicrobiales bacterium]|jgi:alpha-D-xyloside xylohydrolase|nr:DUF5110 domain-containing protein [Verrucomicrobiales bacterium]